MMKNVFPNAKIKSSSRKQLTI